MLRQGERIGDWIVEARLGEGEHGAIFLARHGLNLNLRGALKVARPPDYAKARSNFIAEIEPLLMLRHEALIHVLGWGEDHERNLLWMTTELVRGQSLEERLDQGPFQLEELGFVFGRLAGALALIHSHGAHHGDLRPSDVLLAEGRHIRITGFGTVFREGTQGQLDAESLAYVGPEYFDDPEGCSPVAADVYALGLILHEAITGVRVFPIDPALKPAPQMARIMGMKMRMGPLDPGEDVPLPLRRIVLQTTDPDPLARPPDLSGFLTALSMATRDRDEQDIPRIVSAPSAPSPSAPAPSAPAPSEDGPASVRLEISVLHQQQRPTPFPFAPPGWGPRAHRVPSPMAGLVRPAPQIDVPEPGVVREVQVHTRELASPAPPVSDGPLYDEPGLPDLPDDTWDEPASVPPPEAAITAAELPEPTHHDDEPEEAHLVEEGEGDAVLVDQGSAWPAEPADDQAAQPAAPASAAVESSSLRADRERQRRAFVPPPPVPDPTLVAPTAVQAPQVPEAPSIVPVDLPSAPEPVEPAVVPPAPVFMDGLPSPVAPSELPVVPPSPTLLPLEEEPAPPPVEPEPDLVDPVGALEDSLDAAPVAAPEGAFDAPEPALAPVLGHDPHLTHVPVEAPDPMVEAPAEELPAELDDDEDWSWHDEGADVGAVAAPMAEAAHDPYTRPIDQLYADDLDPSASDIAADVFGDHGGGARWMKWAVPVVVIILIGIFFMMFLNRDQPSAGDPVPTGDRTPAAASPASASTPPPPVEPEPAMVEPDPEPLLDLEAVVAGEPPAAAPVEAETVSAPPPSARSTGRSSTGGRTPAVSSAPAPVAQPEPAVVEPAVAMVEPAPAPAASAKSVMDYLRDGWSSLDTGNLVGAQGAFMAALSMESGNGMAHYGLGQVAERARDYNSASYHYGRALGSLGANPTMKGELEGALQRVGAKAGAAAAPAAAAQSVGAAQPPAEDDAIDVTRKKRDELGESFRQELWDEDPTE